jgi:hypothetical protein
VCELLDLKFSTQGALMSLNRVDLQYCIFVFTFPLKTEEEEEEEKRAVRCNVDSHGKSERQWGCWGGGEDRDRKKKHRFVRKCPGFARSALC